MSRTYGVIIPMLVMLDPRAEGGYVRAVCLRASDLVDSLGEKMLSGKLSPLMKQSATGGTHRALSDSAGTNPVNGTWSRVTARTVMRITMQLSLLDKHDEVADVAFPVFRRH